VVQISLTLLQPPDLFNHQVFRESGTVRSLLQYREGAASNLDPANHAIKVGLGMRLQVAVQPGRTNLWLGTLLYSRTNANDEGRIGCGQARAKTEDKWRMESVAHATILGEQTANVNSSGTLRFLAIGDTVENEIGRPVLPYPLARVCSGLGPNPQDPWWDRNRTNRKNKPMCFGFY